MLKQLLDQLIKSKLDNMHFTGADQGWQQMEKMLDAGKGGSWAGKGFAGNSKLFLVSGVAVVGVATLVISLNIDNDASGKKENLCVPEKNIQTQEPVQTQNNLASDSKTVVYKDLVVKKPLRIKKHEPLTSENSINPEVGMAEVESVMTEVIEKPVKIEPELISESQDNSVKLNDVNPDVKMEVRANNNDIRPIPVPAKDVFKKKKRGLLYFLGLKK